eukprot:TRINITY_DN4814_c0_g1_i2.p1 TRINITY_DN4814_c0_g1~~TRINITY_DN4814_c0_g1_i2.p1  ORF type:complete len:1029 (+),score=151.83 TRINITY_DN4814_c0_g1_i2:71-3157(+)
MKAPFLPTYAENDDEDDEDLLSPPAFNPNLRVGANHRQQQGLQPPAEDDLLLLNAYAANADLKSQPTATATANSGKTPSTQVPSYPSFQSPEIAVLRRQLRFASVDDVAATLDRSQDVARPSEVLDAGSRRELHVKQEAVCRTESQRRRELEREEHLLFVGLEDVRDRTTKNNAVKQRQKPPQWSQRTVPAALLTRVVDIVDDEAAQRELLVASEELAWQLLEMDRATLPKPAPPPASIAKKQPVPRRQPDPVLQRGRDLLAFLEHVEDPEGSSRSALVTEETRARQRVLDWANAAYSEAVERTKQEEARRYIQLCLDYPQPIERKGSEAPLAPRTGSGLSQISASFPPPAVPPPRPDAPSLGSSITSVVGPLERVEDNAAALLEFWPAPTRPVGRERRDSQSAPTPTLATAPALPSLAQRTSRSSSVSSTGGTVLWTGSAVGPRTLQRRALERDEQQARELLRVAELEGRKELATMTVPAAASNQTVRDTTNSPQAMVLTAPQRFLATEEVERAEVMFEEQREMLPLHKQWRRLQHLQLQLLEDRYLYNIPRRPDSARSTSGTNTANSSYRSISNTLTSTATTTVQAPPAPAPPPALPSVPQTVQTAPDQGNPASAPPTAEPTLVILATLSVEEAYQRDYFLQSEAEAWQELMIYEATLWEERKGAKVSFGSAQVYDRNWSPSPLVPQRARPKSAAPVRRSGSLATQAMLTAAIRHELSEEVSTPEQIPTPTPPPKKRMGSRQWDAISDMELRKRSEITTAEELERTGLAVLAAESCERATLEWGGRVEGEFLLYTLREAKVTALTRSALATTTALTEKHPLPTKNAPPRPSPSPPPKPPLAPTTGPRSRLPPATHNQPPPVPSPSPSSSPVELLTQGQIFPPLAHSQQQRSPATAPPKPQDGPRPPPLSGEKGSTTGGQFPAGRRLVFVPTLAYTDPFLPAGGAGTCLPQVSTVHSSRISQPHSPSPFDIDGILRAALTEQQQEILVMWDDPAALTIQQHAARQRTAQLRHREAKVLAMENRGTFV